MNISRNWLKEFVDIEATDREYDEIMTIAGQKVETTTRMDAEIKNVVVGKVLSMARHENSDHMWVCMVDVGAEQPVQIVTGAQNVHEGDLVPVAQHNSYLPGGVHITKGKLRGVESCGMLCSFKELGLTQNDVPDAYEDGIWILNNEDCTVGEDINHVMGTDDSIVEFEITNNRRTAIPCWASPARPPQRSMSRCSTMSRSSRAARRASCPSCWMSRFLPKISACATPRAWCATSKLHLHPSGCVSGCAPPASDRSTTSSTSRTMSWSNTASRCTPLTIAMSRAARSSSAARARTRRSPRSTAASVSSQPDMLVIADETKPVGLAGIMGGENSEIVDDTADVVFESANFLGASIRKTALALGMRTDASAKFEKDIDPMLTVPAVNRACELVEMLGAGEVVDGMIDILNYIPEPVTLPLEPAKINALLGTDIPEADMVDYLRREEVPVVDGMVQVPSWRPDLRCMADLAEEVARYYGYNKIDTTLMRGATTMGGYSETQKLENAAGAAARAMGYSEIITYSFVSPSTFDSIRIPADSPLRKTVKLINPLGEDRSIMRTVILPSMLDILARNFALKNKGVKLYELGKIYLPVEGQTLPDEPKRLIFGTYGEHEDFFSMKGEIVALLEQLNAKPATFVAEKQNPSYHPGRCANILIDGKVMGVLGQIHPLIAENYGIGADVYVAELDFTALEGALEPERVFHSLPKFPTVTRDLALVCDESITVGALEDCIAEAGGKLLRKIDLFDIYRGPGIAPGKKSVAFSLELRADDRTLTDEDSVNTVNRVLDALREKLDVMLR